jgi:hypothetical protein
MYNNYCTNCSADLGKNNNRQLCNKTYCTTIVVENKQIIYDNLLQKCKNENKINIKNINIFVYKYKQSTDLNKNKIYLNIIHKYKNKISKNIRKYINHRKNIKITYYD